MPLGFAVPCGDVTRRRPATPPRCRKPATVQEPKAEAMGHCLMLRGT